MGEVSSIAAYSPFTSDDLSDHLSTFGSILINLGIAEREVNPWLSRNLTLLPKDEFASSEEWHTIQSNGITFRARKYIMSWSKDVFPALDRLWLQCGLHFEYHELVDPAKAYIKPGSYFLPGISKAIWKIMRQFAGPFGQAGIYFVHEMYDYPWEVMLTGEGSLWQFNMALIPQTLMHRFEPMPTTVQRADLEYGVALLSRGNPNWPIVWPEVPWNEE